MKYFGNVRREEIFFYRAFRYFLIFYFRNCTICNMVNFILLKDRYFLIYLLIFTWNATTLLPTKRRKARLKHCIKRKICKINSSLRKCADRCVFIIWEFTILEIVLYNDIKKLSINIIDHSVCNICLS